MADLRRRAECGDNEQIEAVIIGSEQKAVRQEEYDHIAQGLVTRNAIPDLKQIEEEASGFELDALTSEIQRREDRERSIDDELFKREASMASCYRKMSDCKAARNPRSRRKKLKMPLRKCAQQWRSTSGYGLRPKCCGEPSNRIVRSIRGQFWREPVSYFSRLTLGDHSGLTTSFGDHDRPVLVAIRKNKRASGSLGG
jgi:hypothetical protein